ncbi:MAG: 50S ribosomal protein L22 [Candidatus Levybacteria bacterium RIFCSPHIGHO2_01_FULL_40_10]|nr:MAG: 50S ribosomal protein L22 [Candidatus Levybacteria bacterium RIFCSPHIGHO2_01_FULL_40_10]
MEYIAIAKNIKISPRKVRLVVDSVKKKKLASALLALTVMSKRASVPIKKAIDSAVANAINNFAAKREDLTIRDIQVTEGIAAKRFHFAARGRTRPYKRRASHIRVILSDNKLQIPSTKSETNTNETKVQKEEENKKGGSK